MYMSIMDDNFPMEILEQAFTYQYTEAKACTHRVVQEIFDSNIPQVSMLKPKAEKLRLVVDADEAFLQDYQDGLVHLAHEKGHMVAQLKVNGVYSSKLPIKEERYFDGPDKMQLQTAVQLQEIAVAIKEILGIYLKF